MTPAEIAGRLIEEPYREPDECGCGEVRRSGTPGIEICKGNAAGRWYCQRHRDEGERIVREHIAAHPYVPPPQRERPIRM